MRALYIPLAVLAVILGVSLWIGQHTQVVTEEQHALLDEVASLAGEKNWPQAAQCLQQAAQRWEHHRLFLHTTTRHDELGEIQALISGAEAACLSADEDEFHVLLAQLRLRLRLLAGNQALTWGNIL